MTRLTFLLSAFCLSVLTLGPVAAHAGSPGTTPAPMPMVPTTSGSPARPGTPAVRVDLIPIEGGSSLLTGTVKDACEAMLCLGAIGSAPGECAQSLAKYHAAKMWGMGDAFLLMCPVVK